MRKILLSLCVLSLLFLVGCGGVMKVGNSGVIPASIMTDVNYPAEFLGGKVSYNMETPTKYSIIGPVNAAGESSNILGIVAQGDNGYKKLMDAANRVGADAVVNVVTDLHFNSYIFGAYTKVTTNLSGIAVRFDREGGIPSNAGLFLPQQPVYTPPVYQPLPPQPVKIGPDKNKSYFLMINGQKYGPVSVKQIDDLKNMGYCNDNSDIVDPDTNKTYKVSELK
ncbi:hypothetical protein KA977_14770 [Candidatus Dependentiae bacterium]|nr:hypothetical protein [Candidatus Dependentiae bacterium]